MRDLWRLLVLFRPHLGWLLLGALLSLATLLANIGLLAVSGWFITAMAVAGAAGVSINYFTPAAIIRALAIVRTVGRYGERYLTHDATLRILARLRVWFYRRLEPLMPAALHGRHEAELLDRMVADIDSLNGLYIHTWIPLLSALVASAVVLGVVAYWSPPLALWLGLLLVAGGLLLPVALYLGDSRAVERLQRHRSLLRRFLVEQVAGLGELWICNALPRRAAQLERLQDALGAAERRLNRHQALAQGLLANLAQLGVAGAVVLAVPLLEAGRMPPPELAMLVFLSLSVFEAVAPLPLAFQSLAQALQAGRRLFELVDRPSPLIEVEPLIDQPPALAEIRLQGIGFDRAPADAAVLTDIDLQLRLGEKVALVGHSGAGKSTLLDLLMRFEEYDRGRLLLDGIEARRWRPEQVRAGMAWLGQFDHLFNTTIAANLRVGDPQADTARLWGVLEAVGLAGEIRTLPQGLDTLIGAGGTNLSGGQQRRLMLARTLLRPAPWLLLDEPLEGLDRDNEDRILALLAGLPPERGLLMATHRLRGLEAMDCILVMEQGRIVERGDHHTLLARGGRYAALHAVIDPRYL